MSCRDFALLTFSSQVFHAVGDQRKSTNTFCHYTLLVCSLFCSIWFQNCLWLTCYPIISSPLLFLSFLSLSFSVHSFFFVSIPYICTFHIFNLMSQYTTTSPTSPLIQKQTDWRRVLNTYGLFKARVSKTSDEHLLDDCFHARVNDHLQNRRIVIIRKVAVIKQKYCNDSNSTIFDNSQITQRDMLL